MLKYFSGKISQGFVAIYSARMVLRAVVGLLGLFLPIFLYELFGLEIKYVIFYFLIGHFLYATLVAGAMKYLNRYGLRRSLITSLFAGAGYYVVFFFISRQHPGWDLANSQLWWLLASSIILITAFRLLYWVPVHTDLAKFTDKKNRAKQLSIIEATAIFLGAILPLLAGWIIVNYSYDFLFLLAIMIYVLAIFPLSTLPRTRERFSWTYKQTWQVFLSKERCRTTLAYMGDGAESVISVIVWPIFIWELLKGNYFEVGALTALIVVVTVILQLFIGKLTDKSSKSRMLKLSSPLYALGWVLKIFIATAFQIFIVSAYHSFVRLFIRTSFDTIFYEDSADQGHYVDEYTVLHEMAIQYGKVIMLILVLFSTIRLGLEWTFILAAISVFLFNFLARQRKKHA